MSKNIHEAILAIMKEVGYVQKESKPGVSYTLKSEEAVLKAIRPIMIANDVIMIPVDITNSEPNSYTNHKDTYFNEVKFTRKFKLVHVPSETFEEVVVYGVGNDTGDKSGNKAMTVAKKYALLDTFLIVTGDDPDYEQSPDEKPLPKKAWTKKQRDIIQNHAPSVNPEQIDRFLDMSGLSAGATVGDVKKFALLYQGNYDEHGKKGDALQFAKDNMK